MSQDIKDFIYSIAAFIFMAVFTGYAVGFGAYLISTATSKTSCADLNEKPTLYAGRMK